MERYFGEGFEELSTQRMRLIWFLQSKLKILFHKAQKEMAISWFVSQNAISSSTLPLEFNENHYPRSLCTSI